MTLKLAFSGFAKEEFLIAASFFTDISIMDGHRMPVAVYIMAVNMQIRICHNLIFVPYRERLCKLGGELDAR